MGSLPDPAVVGGAASLELLEEAFSSYKAHPVSSTSVRAGLKLYDALPEGIRCRRHLHDP